MKTIGLIGGMTWWSSAEYYRIINETIKKKLGGLHSARIVLYSIDFEELEKLQHNGMWREASDLIIEAAKRLEVAGSDFVSICSVTGHEGAENIGANINIPLLHIADITGTEIASKRLKNIGLLGTRFTMERDFYKGRLSNQFGLNIMIPNAVEREFIHHVIYSELCLGEIRESSKAKFKGIIKGLVSNGAEGIILGCTELCLLIKPEDCNVPLFDTTTMHAKAVVNYALDNLIKD